MRVIDNLPANGEINVTYLLGKAQTTFTGAQYVDLELHLTDGRILIGELESTPKGFITVDPASPPDWLRFV